MVLSGVCQQSLTFWSVTLQPLQAYSSTIPHIKRDIPSFHMRYISMMCYKRFQSYKTNPSLRLSSLVMSLGNHGVQIEYKLSLFEDLNRSNVYAAVMLPSKLRISVPPSLHSLLMSLFVGSWYCNCRANGCNSTYERQWRTKYITV